MGPETGIYLSLLPYNVRQGRQSTDRAMLAWQKFSSLMKKSGEKTLMNKFLWVIQFHVNSIDSIQKYLNLYFISENQQN